ncbi:MAG: cation:proton antiporter [bacterium]
MGMELVMIVGTGGTSVVEQELLDLLVLFMIAGGVSLFTKKILQWPYTIALLIAGFFASLMGLQIGFTLTHDIILFLLLPVLLFEGSATIDLEHIENNITPILLMAIIGLIVSIVLLGLVGPYLFGFPLLISLLFATIVLPTDPISVLAVFDDIGAPERLSVLVEGESLMNDGVAVVIYSSLLTLLASGKTGESLTTLQGILELGGGIIVSSVGGALVGLALGYIVYRIMVNLDDAMTEIILTFILIYGSFMLAEHYLHVSGVIATVFAGLFMGNRGAEYAMSPKTKLSIFNSLDTVSFLVNTFIFIMIGLKTPITDLGANAHLIIPAILAVTLVRVITVYPLTELANRFIRNPIPLNYQHVMVWGGLHASIPIALVLGLPEGTPYGHQMRVMVFGVAAFGLIVQGLTMKPLVEFLDIVTESEEGELYQLLVTKARAIDAAIDSAENLRDRGEVPSHVFDRVLEKYRREKKDITETISDLLQQHPDIKKREMLTGERRMLKREQSAVKSAKMKGTTDAEIAEELLDEIRFKLEIVQEGKSTLEDHEEFETRELWREKIEEYGLYDKEKNTPDEA